MTEVEAPGVVRTGRLWRPTGSAWLKPVEGPEGGTGTRDLYLEVLEVKDAEAPPERGPEYMVFIEQPEFDRGILTQYRGITDSSSAN